MFATQPQTKTEQPPTLAEIVLEETDNGREIIRFFLDVMRNRVEDAKLCHRIQAATQLAKLGSKEAEEFLKAVSRSENGRAPSPTPGKSRPKDKLADVIKLETDDGKEVVRFLADAMRGKLDGFKPCHRIASAKELLRRGFDSSPGHTNNEYEDHDESFDDDPSSPNYVDPNAIRRNKEDDPFDFENYDEEQYRRDGHGGRALRHIYGNTETMIVAIDAANHSRHDAHIPKRDFTPVDNPEDDPYGKGCYGYNALSLYFHDDVAIRAANKAVEEYKKRKAERPEEETAREGPPVDRPSCCFPKPTAPSSSEEDDTMPPERPQNPSVGAGFKPDRGLARPSTGRESEPDQFFENPAPSQSKSQKLSDAKDPPRKRPVKIFVGPPDEDPRQCRDPGDFQGAIDSIWSAGVF